LNLLKASSSVLFVTTMQQIFCAAALAAVLLALPAVLRRTCILTFRICPLLSFDLHVRTSSANIVCKLDDEMDKTCFARLCSL
jgi:hypothetical protein